MTDTPILYGRVDFTAEYCRRHMFARKREVEIVRLSGGPFDGKEAFVFKESDAVGWESEYHRDPKNPSHWKFQFDTFL